MRSATFKSQREEKRHPRVKVLLIIDVVEIIEVFAKIYERTKISTSKRVMKGYYSYISGIGNTRIVLPFFFLDSGPLRLVILMLVP